MKTQASIKIIFLIILSCIITSPNNIFSQSVLSDFKSLSFHVNDMLDKEKNPALMVNLPKLNNQERFNLNWEILDSVHQLNIADNTDLAKEILLRIDIEMTDINSVEENDESTVLVNNDYQFQELKDHLEKIMHRLAHLPSNVQNDESQEINPSISEDSERGRLLRYFSFLKAENLYFSEEYDLATNKFSELLEYDRADSKWGWELILFYAKSQVKSKDAVDIDVEKVYQHLQDAPADILAKVIINFTSRLIKDKDIEKTTLLLSMVNEINELDSLELYQSSIKLTEDIEFLETILNNSKSVHLKTLTLMRIAQIEIEKSQLQKAGLILDRNFDHITNKIVKKSISDTKNLHSAMQNFSTKKIGVLLPFSYLKFSSLVKNVVEGLLLAEQEANGQFTLVFEDTQLRPEVAEQKARKLILEDKVSAIIGPLAKKTTTKVGVLADLFKIPIISLSLTADIGEEFEYLFRMQINPNATIDSIISYASDYLNIADFSVIMLPDKKNNEKLQHITEVLSERGQTISNIYSIDNDQKDFREMFRELSGKRLYLTSADRRKNLEKHVGDKLQNNLDAFFLFIKPRQFLSLENYFKTYKLNNVWLLMDQWQPEYKYLTSMRDKVIFSGAYFKEGNKTIEEFMEKHWSLFGFKEKYQEPNFYSFFSYNAYRLLTSLLGDSEIPQAERVNYIKDSAYINSVISDFTYNGNGEINIKERIFKINEWKNVTSLFD